MSCTEKLPAIYFINIKETIQVIQQHYTLFQKVSGQDFDPDAIVFEAMDVTSNFWNKVMADDECRGILLGFGEKSSRCFCKGNNKRSYKEEEFIDCAEPKSSNKSTEFKIWTIQDCHIPGFASFLENDEVITKYEAQRKEIMRLYQGKDFAKVSLKKLTE